MKDFEDIKRRALEQVQPEASTTTMVAAAELDQQIATAKKYPRDIRKFLVESSGLATLTEDVAGSCVYALKRGSKVIQGPSARFAEIVASTWGNCRAGARIIHEGSRTLVAQGVFHDLESNSLTTIEVQRRITTSTGARYGDDMIGVTANAACSIALRNAVLKGVPKAFWSEAYDKANTVIRGDAETLSVSREKAMQYLHKIGITHEQILAKLGVASVEEITQDHIVTLRGFATAIRDGDSTVEQMFPPVQKAQPQPEPKPQPEPAEAKGEEEIEVTVDTLFDAIAKAKDAGDLELVRKLTSKYLTEPEEKNAVRVQADKREEELGL